MLDYWTTVAGTFLVATGCVIGVVGLFAFGVRALSQRVTPQAGGASGVLSLVTAALCFTTCTAIVVYGLYLVAAR